jgi:integrase
VNRKALTVRAIMALKAADQGKRYEIMDSIVPGMAVRVTDKGERSFVLIARYPRSRNPTRRSLGRCGVLTLEAARDKARTWLGLVKAGIDPHVEEERKRAAAAAAAGNTFATVAKDFIDRGLKGQRRANVVGRRIRNELITRWGERPITEISQADVRSLIEQIVDRPARSYAHNIYDDVRSLFNWAVARDAYGLTGSPCDQLKRKSLIGTKKPRLRVLTDVELACYWRAAGRLGYPFGPLFHLLALTGARLDEVAGARWREFNLDTRLWTVPLLRFKSEVPYIVPLSDDAVELLNCLPRFKRADHLFSTTSGEKPVSGFSKAKRRLDRRILRTLRAVSRMRGDDPKDVQLERFINHDIRRTVRTRLSGLRIPEHIAEMIIGHGKKGLARVYDQHRYIGEMAEAMVAWGDCLRRIVQPADNIIELRAVSSAHPPKART